MKGFLCLMLSALFLVTVGCSGNSNDQAGKQEQGSHLLSLKVKVIEMVEDEDNLLDILPQNRRYFGWNKCYLFGCCSV